MTRALLLGFNESNLRAMSRRMPAASVVVLEEPDIIRKASLADKPRELSCLAEIVPAAYHDAEDFLAVGLALHAQHRFEAVVPGVEYAVPAAAALAAALGRPGATEEAAALLRDKLRLRETTSRAGISNPRFREVHGPADIAEFAAGGPVVVKPANRQASVGVQILDRCGPAEAAAAWTSMVDADDERTPDRPLACRYMAEERLYGPEYSVEALVREGEIVFQNVTEKTVIPGPSPVEVGHVVPAPLHPRRRDDFGNAMRDLIGATGFASGILHAEWILTLDGPALVECAGRCPGDRVADLIDLAYDIDLRVALVDVLAGRAPALPSRARCGSAIRFVTAAAGRVVRVDGLDAAQRLPGVRDLHIGVSVGSQTRRWASSWDRPGFVLVTAPDADQARTRARAAGAAVQIVTA